MTIDCIFASLNFRNYVKSLSNNWKESYEWK